MDRDNGNKQSNPQPSSQNPSTLSTINNQKGNLSVIIGVFLLLLLVGGASYYLGMKNKKPTTIPSPNVAENTPMPSTTTIPASTSKLVPTKAPSGAPVVNGAGLNGINYTLPSGWNAKLNTDSLFLSPANGGGYLLIKVYNYSGTTGRREYYCQVSKVCIQGTTSFTEMQLGNILGYMASALDNSGGGSEYFGAKGNKFYIISSYNPPSSSEFENNYRNVLNSLIF